MKRLIGTLINAAAVFVGSLLGTFLGSRLREKMRQTVIGGVGLVTAVVGMQMSLGTGNILLVMGSVLVGGILGEFSLVSTFTVTAGLMVVATILVFLLKEPPREPDPITGQNLSYMQILAVAFGAIKTHPGLRYALLYSSVLPLLVGAIQVTFMPHLFALCRRHPVSLAICRCSATHLKIPTWWTRTSIS